MLTVDEITPELEGEQRGIKRYDVSTVCISESDEGYLRINENIGGYFCKYDDVKQLEDALVESDNKVCELELKFKDAVSMIPEEWILDQIFIHGTELNKSVETVRWLVKNWSALDEVLKSTIKLQIALLIKRLRHSQSNEEVLNVWWEVYNLKG